MKLLPGHIAVVMDGNGRWARQRGVSRNAGHRAGVEATRLLVENCVRHGIKALTLFAFSSENWNRPQQEVGLLMELFLLSLKREISRLHKNNIRVDFIGELGAFPARLQQQIDAARERTKNNDGMLLHVAVNYGGRWDILQAVKKVAHEARQGRLDVDSLSEQDFSRYLATAGVQDPDLLIRTSGEQRISNFLLWQLAYTECYFTKTLWPDFDAAELELALDAYAQRQRRFGKTAEQLKGNGENA